MPAWNKTLCLYKSLYHAVFLIHSKKTPDHIAQNLCKYLKAQKSKLKNVILICESTYQHDRLLYATHLETWFILNRKKAFFQIENISIQENQEYFTGEKFKSFKKFSEFKSHFYQIKNKKIIFKPGQILELHPVLIPKPWGQEIWYSGIESRGVSKISCLATEVTVPISWILGAVPNLIFGKKFAYQDPVLIKILDPLPEEITGDLYYELHLEKNEVYVVTDISRESGQIKIGINAEKLKSYGNDKEKFKQEFLKSIQNYEKIRREIDRLIDDKKNVPEALAQKERIQRNIMDDFCGFLNLNVGDVINVPIHVPHALQHGVKVIEFQTPTYERLIISFAQKVLTQSHWDTQKAFDFIKMESFQKQILKVLSKTHNVLKELVCVFPGFHVIRLILHSRTSYFTSQRYHYRILFIVSGTLKINQSKHVLSANQCVILPARTLLKLVAKEKCVFLICSPSDTSGK